MIDELPPTQKGRHHEIRARGLREFARLRRDDEPLDPFKLARHANLLVAPYEAIEPLLSEETSKHTSLGMARIRGQAVLLRTRFRMGKSLSF